MTIPMLLRQHAEDKRLLAHELAHVVQQGGSIPENLTAAVVFRQSESVHPEGKRNRSSPRP
jgi:hypothetical protein